MAQKESIKLTRISRLVLHSYGYFQTRNSYFVCTDPPTIDRIFARLRSLGSGAAGSPWKAPSGNIYPSSIGSLPITSVRDLTNSNGYDSASPPTFQPSLPLSSGHMITFQAGALEADGASINLTIR